MSDVKLWPWQHDAAMFLTGGHRLLDWDPGTGKTFALLEAAVSYGLHKPILYLCPMILRHQVAAEAVRLKPGLRVFMMHSKHPLPDIPDNAELVICHYEILSREGVFKRLRRKKGGWSSLILDEAHLLKNPDARRTRAVYGGTATSKAGIMHAAERVWPASGTFVTKDPSDLWVHYRHLFPEALKMWGEPLNRAAWINEFCVQRDTGFGKKIVGAKNLDKLARVLAPYVSVRRKAELNLPDLIVDAIPLDGEIRFPPGRNRPKYPDEKWPEPLKLAYARVVGPDAMKLTEEAFLRYIGELEPHMGTLRKAIALSKADAAAHLLIDHLDQNPTSKVLVFSQHPDVLDAVNRVLPIGLNVGVIHGHVPQEKREHVLTLFQGSDRHRALLMQTTIGNMGLNLQMADRIFFIDSAWTPNVNEQAISRAHRAGQTRTVHVSFLSLVGTLDERVARVVAARARMIRTLQGA